MDPLEQQPIRVLMIEDNAGDIRLVREMLAEAKVETYQLEHVDQIAKGLIRLKEEDFDIILLDLGLPDGYGINTVSKMFTAVPHLPIIVLTGLDDEMIALQAVQEGAQDYLVKGQMDHRLLIRTIRYAIERKRGEVNLQRAHDELERRVCERTRELMEANAALEYANRAKSEFLSNMSHELRTPLNAILGFTELVLDRRCGDLTEMQAEYLGDVLQSSRHLLSLINDILDLSKVDAGKLELELGEVHLRGLLEGSLVMVREKALKHGIRLGLEVDGVPERIWADERKLKQVLFNLLSNAAKFTPDGGAVTLWAEWVLFDGKRWRMGSGDEIHVPVGPPIGTKAEGKFLLITVADTGIGVRSEDLERIFRPFEQGDNSTSRRYQGTGLGLSLVRKLIELHEGLVWAESEGEAKGSRFRFVIPLQSNTF